MFLPCRKNRAGSFFGTNIRMLSEYSNTAQILSQELVLNVVGRIFQHLSKRQRYLYFWMVMKFAQGCYDEPSFWTFSVRWCCTLPFKKTITPEGKLPDVHFWYFFYFVSLCFNMKTNPLHDISHTIFSLGGSPPYPVKMTMPNALITNWFAFRIGHNQSPGPLWGVNWRPALPYYITHAINLDLFFF